MMVMTMTFGSKNIWRNLFSVILTFTLHVQCLNTVWYFLVFLKKKYGSSILDLPGTVPYVQKPGED